MRFPCLAKNGPDAGRASLWHLNKDAFVLMRDHCAARPSMAVIKRWSNGSAGTRTRNQRLKRALLYRLSYRPAASTLRPRRNFSIQNQPRKLSGPLLQDQDSRNVTKSRSEFFGRSNRKIDKPAALAASQSRSGSSPTWRTSFGCSFINLSPRR